jgi:hypothetical protein
MEPKLVHFEGEAVIHLPDADGAPARIELVAGRDRHSVGGAIAEGPRWWRGRIAWKHRAHSEHARKGCTVRVELSNGRAAGAVVEHTSPDHNPSATIRGLGAPPFEVP